MYPLPCIAEFFAHLINLRNIIKFLVQFVVFRNSKTISINVTCVSYICVECHMKHAKVASFLKKLGYLRNKEVFKNPLFLFPFVSKVFNWYSYYRLSSSQFATHYLIIYEIIFLLLGYVIKCTIVYITLKCSGQSID